jgi:carboxyl-terminal processing protease
VKTKTMVLALALLVGLSQAQESLRLPCSYVLATESAREPSTLLDEAQRRVLIDEALRRVERLHVDPDFDGVDLEELRQAYTPRIESARNDHEAIALIQEMLGWVNAEFASLEELEEEVAQASFTGVGVRLRPLADGHAVGIDYVMPGSPAESAGLARGDRILAVDDRSGCPHPSQIRGPEGTDVTLTVTSPGQPPRRVAITRAIIEPIVEPRALRLDEPGIGYLWPGDFGSPGHPAAIRAALDDIGAFDATDPLDGLILDLRGVIGWDWQALDSIKSLAGLFSDGPLLNLIERSAQRTVDATSQPERLEAVALVILVDADMDPFHALLAAALQERKRALVVGQSVTGAWRLYRFERLMDGSRLTVPSAEFVLADGTRLRRSGLVPDRIMPMDWRDYPEEDDPYVAAAIRLIRTGGIGTE